MKKYIQPEIEVVNLKMNQQILTCSTLKIVEEQVNGSNALAPNFDFEPEFDTDNLQK